MPPPAKSEIVAKTVLFSLCGGGLCFLGATAMADAWRKHLRGTDDAGTMVVSAIFFLLGLCLLWWVLRTARADLRARRLAALYPDEPWRAKPQWVAGRIADNGRQVTLTATLMAVCVNGIAWLIAWKRLSEAKPIHGIEWVIWLFPLIGALLALWALYRLARWLKYGTSVFAMAKIPGVIGGRLEGAILTKAKLHASQAARVKLRSVHRRVTGSGKNRSVHADTLWESEQSAEQTAASYTDRNVIPVAFAIPYACKPTQRLSDEEDFYWELDVSAKTPGVDYRAVFEVPVYVTQDSAPDAPARPVAASPARVNSDISAIAGLRVRELFSGGVLLERAGVGKREVLLAVFTLMGCGALAGGLALLERASTKTMGWFFVFNGGVFMLSSLPRLLISGGVARHDERLEFFWKLCGIRVARRNVERARLDRVEVGRGVLVGKELYYPLVVVTREGKRRRVPLSIRGQDNALTVAEFLEGISPGGHR